MTIIMYERVGLGGRRPSPFSWRLRYALAYKGVRHSRCTSAPPGNEALFANVSLQSNTSPFNINPAWLHRLQPRFAGGAAAPVGSNAGSVLCCEHRALKQT
jgi:hypothetical protein